MIINSIKKAIGLQTSEHKAENEHKALSALLRYFTSGTAEADIDILQNVFVLLNNIERKINPEPRQPRLIVGRKGSGKTAILRYAFDTIRDCNINGLFLTSRDLVFPELQPDAAVAQLGQAIRPALVRAIAHTIGRDLGGILTGSAATLYDTAVASGVRDQDRVSAFCSLLSKLASVIVDKDVEQKLKNNDFNTNKLIRSIRESILNRDRVFFLFVDDTDQISSPEQLGHLNRIWAFLLTIRDICMQVPELRCIISLRDEVWFRLTHIPSTQRDQTDHFQPLVRRISPTNEEILQIIEKRLNEAVSSLDGVKCASPWEPFFEGTSSRMPGSNIHSSWADLIVSRSRGRPRDAIQLIHYAAQRAFDAGKEKINDNIFEETMQIFAEEKVTQLGQELSYECPNIKEVIALFSEFKSDKGSYKYSAQKARYFIGRMPTYFSISLYGKTIRSESDADIFELWNFLFLNGILNARAADSSRRDGYRFIDPAEDPRLVGLARWKDIERCIWEIHPAYRDFIARRVTQISNKLGLPPTRKKQRKRRRY